MLEAWPCPVQGQPGLCLRTAGVGGEPPLSGGLQAGLRSIPLLPSPTFKVQEEARSYLNGLHSQGPQVLRRPGVGSMQQH